MGKYNENSDDYIDNIEYSNALSGIGLNYRNASVPLVLWVAVLYILPVFVASDMGVLAGWELIYDLGFGKYFAGVLAVISFVYGALPQTETEYLGGYAAVMMLPIIPYFLFMFLYTFMPFAVMSAIVPMACVYAIAYVCAMLGAKAKKLYEGIY